MNAMESPLEALAFNYLSFGFITVVNNVWTWIAVITAAVSFWRIKASSTLPAPEPRADFSGRAPSPSPPTTTSSMSSPSSQVERESTQQAIISEKTSSTATTMMFPVVSLIKEEGTKGKLTVYFKQDIDGGECDGDIVNGDREEEELSKEWFENWERVLKMRKGEMGWYSYQDMRVIDGSVVRLWDGCRRRRNAETTAFSVGVVSTW
ncbi:PREDICTED: uncharacterized protein LOC109222908 [Nicotiana attenuata]|uniref:Uncharacterized protein n=1 Tax=Nicotiana attenuata TaxID=49451 RepID=A0A1J6J7U2_NICAT|nr:PREDICTED: uncharacterized protein LOC109222908 [Nicotiana attenuata]OIT05887.1 hypothetical protein A4A49_13320 [Nicotiana attenuata]